MVFVKLLFEENMELSLGDFLDRWSISKLKAERVKTQDSIGEFSLFQEEFKKVQRKYGEKGVIQWAEMFLVINNNIWQLEAGLKSGKEELPNKNYLYAPENREILINLGILSILIRNFNIERTEFKNIVNNFVNEGFQDIKLDHLSGVSNE